MKIKPVLLALGAAVVMFSLVACSDDKTNVSPDAEYPYDLAEYIKLGEYKGLTAVDPGASVTDIDIQDAIDETIEMYTKLAEVKDREVASGDTINLDYTGYIDGEAFENGADTGAELVIGSGRFIPGFEDGLIGVTPGATVTVDATFPDPYPNDESKAGKTAQFEVTVNYIVEYDVPEYNDAFVAENFPDIATTTAQYEAHLYDTLLEEAENARKSDIINQVWEQVSANTEVLQYPQTEYDAKYKEAMDYYNEVVSSYYNMELEQFLTTYQNTTLADFEADLHNNVNASLKEEMMLWQIIRKENIELSDEEYAEGIAEYAEFYESTIEQLEADYTAEVIKKNLLWDEAFEFLADNAVLTEKTDDGQGAES